MLAITRKADYAIRIIAYLATTKPGELISSNQISKNTCVPKKFLARIVLGLIEAGWVESARGAKGGLKLGKGAGNATVAEVIKRVEGPVLLNLCCQGGPTCHFKQTCPIHPTWAKAQAQVMQTLSSCYIVKEARQKNR